MLPRPPLSTLFPYTTLFRSVVAATRTLTFLGRALQQVAIDEDAVLHPAVGDPGQREWPEASGSVDELVSEDRKSTRLNSSHLVISYAVFCLKKKRVTKKTCA